MLSKKKKAGSPVKTLTVNVAAPEMVSSDEFEQDRPRSWMLAAFFVIVVSQPLECVCVVWPRGMRPLWAMVLV